MGDTFMVTPLQAPGLLPVDQMKVVNRVHTAGGDVFD